MSPCCWRTGRAAIGPPSPRWSRLGRAASRCSVSDRRIFAARRLFEAIVEARPDRPGRSLSLDVHVDAAALADEQGAQVVDAVDVVGVLVGDQHAVDPVDVGVEKLLAQVRRGVDQDPGPCRSARAARPAARSAGGGSSGCWGRRRPSRAPAAARPWMSRSPGW